MALKKLHQPLDCRNLLLLLLMLVTVQKIVLLRLTTKVRAPRTARNLQTLAPSETSVEH